MNASKKIQSILDGLAQYLYFDKPVFVQLTTEYGDTFVGVSSKIFPVLSKKDGERQPVLPIIVHFEKIMHVKIVQHWDRSEYYIPNNYETKPARIEINVLHTKLEIVEQKSKNLDIHFRTHVFTTDSSKERLFFSSDQRDLKRFDREILGIEDETKS